MKIIGRRIVSLVVALTVLIGSIPLFSNTAVAVGNDDVQTNNESLIYSHWNYDSTTNHSVKELPKGTNIISVASDGYENAMFPMDYLNITQGVNVSYYHQGSNAIDNAGKDS